jgi:hypothetical protein
MIQLIVTHAAMTQLIATMIETAATMIEAAAIVIQPVIQTAVSTLVQTAVPLG